MKWVVYIKNISINGRSLSAEHALTESMKCKASLRIKHRNDRENTGRSNL